MDDKFQGEMTPRQLLGFEYTQHTKDIPGEYEQKLENDIWSIEIHGSSSNPPEIEKNESLASFVVYYPLDKFVVEGKDSHKSVDLIKVTPETWKQYVVSLTSPGYRPPEIHDAMTRYVRIDSDRQELVIGNILEEDTHDPDQIVKIVVWNTLVAKFLSEVGEPANDESIQGMNAALLERRTDILDVLGGRSDADMVDLFNKPF